MYKSLLFLYLACFCSYLLFTRQPDYFDGEFSPASIQWQYDSAAAYKIPHAVFTYNLKSYAVDARYVGRSWNEGERTEVIYESSDPQKGAVYQWWGYWIRWEELAFSVVLLIGLYQVAVAVTNNPDSESRKMQLDYKAEKQKKYLE